MLLALKSNHSGKLAAAGLLAALLLVLGLGACGDHGSAAEYARQLQACTLAEGNGLLDSAVQACGKALSIAEEQAYTPEMRSGLLFRMGKLERQRGNFKAAEMLVRQSLAIEENSGRPGTIAKRLVELAVILAGEDRWEDGSEFLQRVTPLLETLAGKDRLAAGNAFRGYSLHLEMLGQTEQATRYMDLARELTGK